MLRGREEQPHGVRKAIRLRPAQRFCWIRQLKREDEQKAGSESMSVARTLVHPRVWHLACIGFGHGFATYTFSFWLPQIMKSVLGEQPHTVIGFVVMIPNLLGHIGEGPVAVIVVEHVSARRQPARPTCGVLAGHGSELQIETNRVRDEEIEIAIPLVVQECAPSLHRGGPSSRRPACLVKSVNVPARLLR
jgi:hypothetical protein